MDHILPPLTGLYFEKHFVRGAGMMKMKKRAEYLQSPSPRRAAVHGWAQPSHGVLRERLLLSSARAFE